VTPFDPGADQRFSFDRRDKGRTNNAILWEGDVSMGGFAGCVSVGVANAEFAEYASITNDYRFGSLDKCGGGEPWQTFVWVGGADANVSTLRYSDDGHGSGPLCLGACGVVPQCSFEYDYSYNGPAFSTIAGSTAASCCTACKAEQTCAVFVLNGTSCELKVAMTGGTTVPGIISGDPNR
jgi:hypothetical protein